LYGNYVMDKLSGRIVYL